MVGPVCHLYYQLDPIYPPIEEWDLPKALMRVMRASVRSRIVER